MTDEMDDSEMWRLYKQKSQEKRERNRNSSPAILKAEGIGFEEKNNGVHLVVKHNGHTVDFWPGTGKWLTRGGRFTVKGRGVRKLIEHLTEAKHGQ